MQQKRIKTVNNFLVPVLACLCVKQHIISRAFCELPIRKTTVEDLLSGHCLGCEKGVRNWSWPLMGMKKYRVCMGVEKNGVLRRRSQVELSACESVR